MSIDFINRTSSVAFTVLCVTAFGTVFQAVVRGLIAGHVPPPEADEGTAAHIFQLAVVGAVGVGLILVATTDWRHPWRGIRPILLPGVALVLAVAIVFYFENIYYPAHY
jgi:hypothetical protein